MSFSNPILKYVFFVLAISWLFTLTFVINGVKLGQGFAGTVLPMIFMFIPALTAFTLFKLEKKIGFKQAAGIRFSWNRWFSFAWLAPVLFSLVIIAVNLLFPNTELSLDMSGFIEAQKALMSPEAFAKVKADIDAMPIHPLALTFISTLIAGITINALFAFGEELFWRGYLYRLLEDKGFWKISFITGFIWGIWHAPLIMMGHNYPHHPYIGVVMMIIWIMLLTPIFTFIRQRSHSVIASAIMHGSLNASVGIPIVVLVGGHELINGWLGLSGFIALAIVDLILYIYLKRAVRSD